MATGFQLDNNQYTGSPTDTVLLPAVASSVTVEENLCALHTVNGIKVVLKGDVQTIIQDSTPDFTGNGKVIQNFSDVTLAPKPFSIQLDLPKIDLYDTYTVNYITGGLVKFGTLDPLTRGMVYEQIALKNSSNLEELAWNGTLFEPANYVATSTIDGWVSQAIAGSPASNQGKVPTSGRYAATAIDAAGVVTLASTANLRNGDVITFTSVASSTTVNGTTIVGQSFKISVESSTTIKCYPFDGGNAIVVTGAGTKAIGFQTINAYSVFDALSDVVRLMPRKAKVTSSANKGRTIIAVPVHVADAYFERLVFNGNSQINYLENSPNVFGQNVQTVRRTTWGAYEVAIVPGMKPNTVMIYNSENLLYAVNTVSDSSSLTFIDLAGTTGDQKFRVRLDFGLDVNIAYKDEIALVSAKA